MADYNKYKAEKEKEIKKLINDFSNVVNSMSFGDDELKIVFKEFSKQHNTLQQSMFRVIISLIVQMSTDEYKTDGRNEFSKKIAIQLVTGFADQIKEQFLNEGDYKGDAFYEKKAEDLKQACLKMPQMFLGLPTV